jgi:hypothetical protein
MKPSIEREQRLYDALKLITQYETPDQLRRNSHKSWGLGYEEALEYAYENIQSTAKQVLKGMRRPNDAAAPADKGERG